MTDLLAHNRRAWDDMAARNDRWTVPVTPAAIARARAGDLQLVLTPTKPIPAAWYPPLAGLETLVLAGGGGQQGPMLAAAGARVTVLDNSPAQLARDRLVAEREGLELATVAGDMRSMPRLPDAAFDFIVHPCSNLFVDDVAAVWREAFRLLRPGGTMLAGFCNPLMFLFDPELEKAGTLQLRFEAPYSDLTSVTEAERVRLFGEGPLSFGHTLDAQIGGQLAAGFVLTGFYEDGWGGAHVIDRHLPAFIATRARKA